MKLNSKASIKLSKRLQKIEQMVTSQQYDHIWDCCCDHGLLGFTLLSRQAASNIHFVDIVPELMAEVENKLERFYTKAGNSSWKTHCIDVAKLPLKDYERRQLIIIAGVGGDLMIQFIEAIHRQYPNVDIDFLLCPVHHQFSLRSKLIELDFSLKEEVLVEDNQRFYEIIYVSSTSEVNIKINPVGDNIWQPISSTYASNSAHANQQTQIANRYLTKTLSHYQRIQQGFEQSLEQGKSVQHIIDAYRAITLPSLTL